MKLAKPEFHLARVDAEGTHDIEIVSVAGLTLDVGTDRRGFLGAAVTASTVLAAGSAVAQPAKPRAAPARKPAPRLSPAELCSSGFAHDLPVRAALITPDGASLITASEDGTIKLWQLADGKLIKTFRAPSVRALALSANGKSLAVGTHTQLIELRALPDGTVTRSIQSDQYGVDSLAFGGDDTLLAAAGNFRAIEIRDAVQGTLRRKLTGFDKGVRALAISRDGAMLLSGGGTELKVWNVATGEVVRSLDGPAIGVNSVAISPDGTTLAAGGFDSTIALWRMPEAIALTLDSLWNLSWVKSWFALKPAARLHGHASEVRALAFSPDGTMLASGSADQTIKLWSLPEGAALNTLSGHTAGIRALSFGGDGKLLASASDDKTVRLWRMPQGELHSCMIDVKPAPPKPATTQRSPTSPGSTTTGGSYTYCSCNKVCVCIPVRCQAHRLLHDDPVVRTMAREILLVVGAREAAYMEWAAETAQGALRQSIAALMRAVADDVRPDPGTWPSIAECAVRLDHPDDIVALMAAQLICLQHASSNTRVSAPLLGKARLINAQACARPAPHHQAKAS